MDIKININQAKDLLVEAMKAQLVPMLVGSPAVGKSSIVKSIADDYELEVKDLRLAQCDPTDLLGFPSIDKENQKASYVPMSTFPIKGDPLPDGKKGWLLFLDEFNSADRSVQKAAYKLVLDKMVGEHDLHENCAIICAGNLETDNAIVEEMSTALQSRLVHFELELDHNLWIEWAEDNGIDHTITSFINFAPDKLYTFSPNHTDKTYASPRTWEFASKLVKNLGLNNDLLLPALAGTISNGVAREYIAFTKVYNDLPTIADVIQNGDRLPVPTEPSILYALSGSITHNANETNIDKLMAFIKRMPVEFQVVTMKGVLRRHRKLASIPVVGQWFSENAKLLM